MKTGFAFCIVIVAFTSAQGASLRKSWFDLLPSIQETENRVGDVWSDCSKKGDNATINSITLTPDPPVKGEKLTGKASITLKEQVTGGEIVVTLKYGKIPVFSKTVQLCDQAKEMGFPCPLAAKTYDDVEMSVELPGFIPGGHYSGNIEVTDQNKAELACIDLDLKF